MWSELGFDENALSSQKPPRRPSWKRVLIWVASIAAAIALTAWVVLLVIYPYSDRGRCSTLFNELSCISLSMDTVKEVAQFDPAESARIISSGSSSSFNSTKEWALLELPAPVFESKLDFVDVTGQTGLYMMPTEEDLDEFGFASVDRVFRQSNGIVHFYAFLGSNSSGTTLLYLYKWVD